MQNRKDFRAVNPKYDQDWVNGVNEAEYEALFQFLKDKNISSVLDLAGGSGKLTRILIERGYDVVLFDVADNMVEEAYESGVPKDRAIVGDIFSYDFGRKFDCIILKSAMHEIPLEKSSDLHSVIYGNLNSGGWFVDWDVHTPTDDDASWLKKWVNLKDTVAGLDDLVTNRHLYSEGFIVRGLEKTGFKNINIVHRFFYTLSISKMSKMYWHDDVTKTKTFFDGTVELLKTLSDRIIAKEISSSDIELKAPAVIIVAQK